MNIVLHSNKIDEYLRHDNVIDYDNDAIAKLANTLFKKANNKFEFIKAAYEFVRDNISHSADINEDIIIGIIFSLNLNITNIVKL